MKRIGVGIIGTGWCGGIRAETCAGHPLVKSLHVAETRPERLREIAAKTGATTATADYRELLRIDGIDAIMISATPESTHFPMARDALAAGKHVLLEKPIAIELAEADRAHRTGAAEQGQVHRRLFAALQSEVRLREAVCARRHHRHAGERAREQAHHPRTGEEDHRPLEALAGGDGVDARSRLRALVPGAVQAGARVFAARLSGRCGRRPARIFPIASGSR